MVDSHPPDGIWRCRCCHSSANNKNNQELQAQHKKKLSPIFYFHGMINFFNYLLTTQPHNNCDLSPQTECGDTAAAAPRWQLKWIGTANARWEPMYFSFFTWTLSFIFFNYWLMQHQCDGSYLSPQIKYEDAMAVAPLLTTIRNRDSKCIVRKVFPIFSLTFYLIFSK